MTASHEKTPHELKAEQRTENGKAWARYYRELSAKHEAAAARCLAKAKHYERLVRD